VVAGVPIAIEGAGAAFSGTATRFTKI
jgi:hypothetical protein